MINDVEGAQVQELAEAGIISMMKIVDQSPLKEDTYCIVMTLTRIKGGFLTGVASDLPSKEALQEVVKRFFTGRSHYGKQSDLQRRKRQTERVVESAGSREQRFFVPVLFTNQ